MNPELIYLKENLLREERLAKELALFSNLYKTASSKEREFLKKSCSSTINQFEIIYRSTEELLNKLDPAQTNMKAVPKFDEKKTMKEYARISGSSGNIILKKEDKTRYLEELKVKNIKINNLAVENETIQKPSQFVLFSSRLFKGISKSISNNFDFLDKDLKQADMPYIQTSYLSICISLFFISLIFCLAVAFGISAGKSLLISARNLSIALLVPIGFFVFLIYYPKFQVNNNSKKLENELPFAFSHMSAVASSKIEPAQIFIIMASSKDYPLFSRQMKKVSNQINIYGYDLSTALRNVAQQSSNKKFSEFLNGFISIVNSGGDLLLYIKEKSKDALLDYKLSRERYSATISVYSEIYSALLIVAPLILMLVLSLISGLGATLGNISVSFLANIGVISIIVLNVLFIIFLNLTQPEM